MRLTLDYRTPSNQPRVTLSRCITFAGTLIGLALCVAAPLAISVAGVYWDSAAFVLIGAAASGVSLAFALLFAAAAVEQFCELCD